MMKHSREIARIAYYVFVEKDGKSRLQVLTLAQTTHFSLFQTETVCRRQFQI